MQEMNDMRRRWFRLLIRPVSLGLLWTLFMLALFTWSAEQEKEHVLRLAERQARAFFQEIVYTRAWNAMHEGVYVYVTEETHPNKFLKAPDTVIRTEDGRELTKINPAYMTRQLSAIAMDRGGVQFRISGLSPIRPENRPDPWEEKALKAFEAGHREGCFAMTGSAVGQVFRYIAPLETEAGCLTCHTQYTREVPAVMGGISVTFAAAPLLESLRETVSNTHIAFAMIWLAGLFGIVFSSHKIQKKTRQVEEANQARSLFMANMCHDMRTPLSGIMGLTERIRKRDLPGDSGPLVDLIESSAGSLLEIVNDITDVSRLEHGRLILRPHAFGLRAMLRDTLAIFGFESDRKGLVFSWQVDDEVPDLLFGDDFRLRQVLANLVGNAVKFTDSGSIRVLVGRVGSGRPERVCLSVSVADTGPGVPEPMREVIFQSFRQGDGSLAKKHQGSGLGLAICRQLVEMMGGRIAVSDNASGGAVFRFTVLLDEAVRIDGGEESGEHLQPEQVSVHEHEPVPGVPSQSILVAEDNPLSQIFFQEVLEEAGHRVTMVDNGEDVLKELRNGRFDMVFMDVQMPGMDGIETVRRIRSETRPWFPREIPVTALTAMVLPEDRERCIAAGMTGCLAKPVTGVDLLLAVAHLAGLKTREQEADDAIRR